MGMSRSACIDKPNSLLPTHIVLQLLAYGVPMVRVLQEFARARHVHTHQPLVQSQAQEDKLRKGRAESLLKMYSTMYEGADAAKQAMSLGVGGSKTPSDTDQEVSIL
eukprot:4416991-Amphidinium_carterae.2